MILHYLTLLLFNLFLFSKPVETRSQALISGEITHSKGFETINIAQPIKGYYNRFFLKDKERLIVDGKFRYVLPCDKSLFYAVNIAGRVLNLALSPTDSIHLKIDLSQLDDLGRPKIQISGSNSRGHDEFSKYYSNMAANLSGINYLSKTPH